MDTTRLCSVAVVGCGNVGSQVVPLLASLMQVGHVRLVDFDRYGAENLGTQRISPRDVGRPKARVQSAALKRIRPDMVVKEHVGKFEDMPLGWLRDHVILSCVDSRAARQAINRAFVLGTPWIDAALSREGSIRARAYLPGSGSCLECGWGEQEYELLEQRIPCEGSKPMPAPTLAPCELGAMAASLQVSLLRQLLSGPTSHDSLRDRQWFYDLPSGRGWTAYYRPNPQCRLDHTPWAISMLSPGSTEMPLGEALALAGGDTAASRLSVPGMVFVRRLCCPNCGSVRRQHNRLSGRIAHRTCRTCGTPMREGAIDTLLDLGAGNASSAELGEPLSRRGLIAGDVVSISDARNTHRYQLA